MIVFPPKSRILQGIQIFSFPNFIFLCFSFEMEVVEIGFLCKNSSILINVNIINPIKTDNKDIIPPKAV